jgi:hypothetical protein
VGKLPENYGATPEPLFNYAKTSADGSRVVVGWWPVQNDWWVPTIRRHFEGTRPATANGVGTLSSSLLLGGSYVADPFDRPERWAQETF